MQAVSEEEAFANANEILQTATEEEAFTHLRDEKIEVVCDNTEEVFDNHNDYVQNRIDAHVDNADETIPIAKNSVVGPTHTGVVDKVKDCDDSKAKIESLAKPTMPSNINASLSNITESDQSDQCCYHACCPGRGRPPDKCCYHRCRKPLGH